MKKKRLKNAIIIGIIIIINLFIINFINIQIKSGFNLKYDLTSSECSKYQLFYTYDGEFGEYVTSQEYDKTGEEKTLKYSIPKESVRLRVDLGEVPAEIELNNLRLYYFGKRIEAIALIDQDSGSMNDIDSFDIVDNKVFIRTSGNDPFFTINLNGVQNQLISNVDKTINLFVKILLCVAFNVTMVILIKSRKLIKELILDIYTSKHLILNLSKNDFKTRFSGSYLGITWAFVQPIVVVIIYWFVFQVGFKSAPMNDFPFILWLIAGMVPWFFFNESLLNSTNSFLEYSYLVKKVVFKISILPVVKLMSAFYVHLFFIFFATIVYMLYGYMPQIYIIQSLYYSFCVFMLALGISYMTSSIVIFFKDLGQIVSILLQFGMWMTPIMYSEEMMPNSIRWILKLNPMYYIVEGYRDTFIRHVWFWERYNKTIYFWGLTVLIFTIGAIIFKKLKPHFSDVL